VIGAPQAAAPAGADALEARGVRGALVVVTGGRRGTPEDRLAVAAALLFDAALAGVVAVEGRKRLGVDRRRVVPGPATTGVAPLVADVRRRVEIVRPDTPWGWCERLAVYAEEAVTDELAAAGLVRRLTIPAWRRLWRHRGAEPVDPQAAELVRSRLQAIAAGRPGRPADVALAAVLHGCDVVDGPLRGRDDLRLATALDRARPGLPDAARALAEALCDRRRSADRVGTWYGDD